MTSTLITSRSSERRIVRFRAPLLTLLAAGALAGLAAPTAAFDKVLLKDGRLIEGTILGTEDDDTVRFEVYGQEIRIPDRLVDKTFVENLADYVPKSKKEEQNLAKGWVLFEGRWMSKERREQELQKRAQEQEAAIAESQRLQDWNNARTVETDYFIMKSNCPDEIIDEFARRMDAYYKFFTDFWSIKRKAGDKRKIKFFLYRNEWDYLRINGMRYGVKGHFSPVTEDLHLFYDALDPEFSIDVLCHEANHLITYLIDPGFMYPRWMHESVAEYFGSAELQDNGSFRLGDLQYGRIVAMEAMEKQGKAPTPKEVLLTPFREFTATDYAVGWSFVHFLMETPAYAKKFQAFFRTLPENREVPTTNERFMDGTRKFVQEPDVLASLERRLGASIDNLQREWQDFRVQNYGEMPARAYYDAARYALAFPEDDGSHVERAFEFFALAVDKGIDDPNCFRRYAELLRKGGVVEGRQVHKPRPPDPARAWEMIQRAIALDPVNAYSYCEAAGILLLDGPVHDIDRAAKLTLTARALAPTDGGVRSLYTELVDKVRETRTRRAAMADAQAVANWTIQPHYFEGQEVPEHIKDLSTEDIRAMIKDGDLDGKDWAFNGVPAKDAATGEEAPHNTWDDEWVQLKDIPWFHDDLLAAGWVFEDAEGAGDAGGAPADGAPGAGGAPADGDA